MNAEVNSGNRKIENSLVPLEWLALKGKEKKKDFVFDMYEVSNRDPHQPFSFKAHTPCHYTTRAQLPMQ